MSKRQHCLETGLTRRCVPKLYRSVSVPVRSERTALISRKEEIKEFAGQMKLNKQKLQITEYFFELVSGCEHICRQIINYCF